MRGWGDGRNEGWSEGDVENAGVLRCGGRVVPMSAVRLRD